MITPDKFTFFLDSGAYGAWSRGAQIDLDEYCAFIKSNIELIEVYANLDVIAGKPGQTATKAQRNAGAEKSWANFLYMKKEGLDPIPVYHAGEDWEHLDRMLKYGCQYIGLGGLVGLDSKLRRHWLDDVFMRITDDHGFPIVKTHGFGMTSIPLIFRYPWYSVDSTTWIKITANGGLYLPAVDSKGSFVFDRIPSTVSVSNQNPKQNANGKHANTMSVSMRAILDRWLKECGKTYAQVEDSYYHRATCNVIFFRKVSEAKSLVPFKKAALRRTSIWL